MGSGELVGQTTSYEINLDSEGNPTLTTYKELFRKEFPYALAVGMTYEQYWYEDVSLAKYYFEAHEIRREQENTKLWLQGAYFYEALTRVSPMFNAMKPQKAHAYIEKPYPISEAEARKRKESELQMKRDILFEKLKSRSNKNERRGDKDVREEN